MKANELRDSHDYCLLILRQMQASVRKGKRHNILTSYVLRLLGLEVHTLSPPFGLPNEPVCC